MLHRNNIWVWYTHLLSTISSSPKSSHDLYWYNETLSIPLKFVCFEFYHSSSQVLATKTMPRKSVLHWYLSGTNYNTSGEKSHHWKATRLQRGGPTYNVRSHIHSWNNSLKVNGFQFSPQFTVFFTQTHQ